MTSYRLGVHTGFAVTRWPRPPDWAEIVRERLQVDLVQHSLDLVALDGPAALRSRQAEEVRVACRRFGLSLHSTSTGVAVSSSNLLLDPDKEVRAHAESWFRRAIAFTADAGGRATGGHVGALSVADARAPARRAELEEGLRHALGRLAGAAWRAGLESFLVENGPASMDAVGHLLAPAGARRVPLELSFDAGRTRDPFGWLLRMGSRAPVVRVPDHEAPDRILAALDRSGAAEVALILEVHPAAGEDGERVLALLLESAATWRDALRLHDR